MKNTNTPELTTLCYIEKDDCYLMLHRVSKENDINKDKWIGVGGHLEADESPEECLLREVKEETGLTLTSFRYRATITFISKEPRRFYEAYARRLALRVQILLRLAKVLLHRGLLFLRKTIDHTMNTIYHAMLTKIYK